MTADAETRAALLANLRNVMRQSLNDWKANVDVRRWSDRMARWRARLFRLRSDRRRIR